MTRKKIGITLATGHHHYDFDYLNYNYILYFNHLDIELIYLPNDPITIEQRLLTGSWEGFVLSGGNDIDAEFFSAATDQRSSYRREYCESKVLEFAIKKRLAVLGICRGLQFINLFFQGSLFEIAGRKHVNVDHDIQFHTEGVFRTRINSLVVNSFHCYGVRKETLGCDLVVLATSADGIVEAIYHQDHPILGVQWHPERRSAYSPVDDDLIRNHFNR